WIRAQHFELAALHRAFEAIVFALEQALARQAALDQEIAALAETAPYRDPRRVVALLPRHRHAVGDGAPGRDRGLPTLPQASGAYGLPGATGCAYESRQYARAPGPRRGGLALSPSPHGRPRAGKPQPGSAR